MCVQSDPPELSLELNPPPSNAATQHITQTYGRSYLTTSEAVVCGQLERVLRAVPLPQRELVFTLVHPTLRAHLHTAGIGEERLGRGNHTEGHS